MNRLLVVIHETIIPFRKLKYYISSPQFPDLYHAVIKRDGEITYLTDPKDRVNGASNSSLGTEQVNNSVNEFSYQIALESPYPSNEKATMHLGYTAQQYKSLGWLLKALKVSEQRVVLHSEIDNTGVVKDPRSFNKNIMWRFYNLTETNKKIDTNLEL